MMMKISIEAKIIMEIGMRAKIMMKIGIGLKEIMEIQGNDTKNKKETNRIKRTRKKERLLISIILVTENN